MLVRAENTAKIMLLSLLFLFSIPVSANTEYPHRPKYPDVRVIELAKLQSMLNKVVIVDVRSKYEFDTLHIKGAVNIPLNYQGYPKEIAELYKKHKKTLVFYCNGKTCSKSYKGTRQAHLAGVKDTYAFDAGVFDWAKAHPDKTVLLGNSPINPNDLISKTDLKKRMLKPHDFEKRISPRTQVLDVRDRIQRDILLFPFKETRVALDNTAELEAVIRKAVKQGKTLLIYDKVGKQVRWMQYRLEAMGVKNYYFMKGGSEAYLKEL